MNKFKFIELEIKEMCEIHALDFEKIYTSFLITKLKTSDLSKIHDIRIRSAVYECLTLYPEEVFKTGLIDKIFKIIKEAHINNEKGYMAEKKTLLSLKELFSLQNDKNWEFLNYKLAFIVSRRLIFCFNGNIEYEQTGECEVSIILQQIITDVNCYINTLKIIHKFKKNINEFHLKSFILRVLKLTADSDQKLEFELKKINSKTVYFLKSKYSCELFIHFYARVLLSSPIVIYWNNIGLNGGYHYLNKRRIIEPNIYNDKTEIVPEIIKFIEHQNKLGFYIDHDMVQSQKERIISQLKKDTEINKKWGEFFSDIDNLKSSSHEQINNILNLESYRKKMKKNQYLKKINNIQTLKQVENELIKNSNLTDKEKRKLENKKEMLENLIKKGIVEWDPKIYNTWIQKDFSYVYLIKIYLEYIRFFEDYKNPVYFVIYFDFRGRNYYNSMVSPTQGWPFRFLYYFEDEDIKGEIENEEEAALINVNNYINIIIDIEKSIGILDQEKRLSLMWILISIGSLTISKKKTISEKEFINEGYNNYKNRIEIEDNLENSELAYYYLIIDNLNKNKKNRYIMKDISGSIFQNASIILGVKNKDKLKYLNLNNDDWHDPYAPLIEEIQKTIAPELVIFFNRKTLKKPIMTKYYNSKFYTSFNYFIKEVRKMKEFKDYHYEKLWIEFKKVYETLKNLEKKLIFKHSNEEYNKFLKKEEIFNIEYDSFKFNIISFKLVPHRLDIKVNNKRITVTTYKQSKIIYSQKTNNSMIPHVFHGEDSHRARVLIKTFKYRCFSIHDAFAVSYSKVNRLIIIANITFNINEKRKFYMNDNKINEKLFSKFIIL